MSCLEVEFSIIIGLVSLEDSERILEVLRAIEKQKGGHSYQVILADRKHSDLNKTIVKQFPKVILLACAQNSTLPQLRKIALDQSIGQYVIVIEDHTVPDENWLDNFDKIFKSAPDKVVAVGGCVENAMAETALDKATFLCEYSSFLTPITEGLNTNVPGMNVAYKKEALLEIDDDKFLSGFWETTVHPALLKAGYCFYTSNRIILYHKKKFTFKVFVKQRYLYSKYFAALRCHNWTLWRKILFAGLTLALPSVLLYRTSHHLWMKKRLKLGLIWSLPKLIVFYMVYSVGEMSGYLFGAKNSLTKIE